MELWTGRVYLFKMYVYERNTIYWMHLSIGHQHIARDDKTSQKIMKMKNEEGSKEKISGTCCGYRETDLHDQTSQVRSFCFSHEDLVQVVLLRDI